MIPSPRPQRQLVVMARWPAPGRCKSRLAAGIGAVRAAAVQRRLTRHALVVARLAIGWLAAAEPLSPPGGGAAELVLAVDGLGKRGARRWGRSLGADRVVLQGPGRLGGRLQRQLRRAGREGCRELVLIGSDLPELDAGALTAAFQALANADWVLGPAADGGYWLIGCRWPGPSPFCGPGTTIAWGSDSVLRSTLALARRSGLSTTLLSRRHDLDRPADLRRWR